MISAIGIPEILPLFFVAGFISIPVIIITQVRKNMTPKDKRGIGDFGGPAKGERHD